ncbi:uncharacterized protein LOC113471150 [Diaphorina citri]|uniref:Uncharacterized protein LOC113471150 n=1 Tax=Diaphorina citri TaxID=121845 RepID=A0A3Q0JFS0_DIACI|nr:uncharacterized protein LOC113471150 [Diaphorina citri]
MFSFFHQVQDLKLMAKQSATLNSQLKKGMKHLATCRRRKCCVCSYTKATFGEYASSSDEIGRGKLISGCFPFHDLRRKVRHENVDSHPSDMTVTHTIISCIFQDRKREAYLGLFPIP